MGYTTKFDGHFEMSPGLTLEQKNAWEDYVEALCYGNAPADHDGPEGYCQWIPTREGKGFMWDGEEKFYHYIEWLKWVIQAFAVPGGQTVNGTVTWQGEDVADRGSLIVENNTVREEKWKPEGPAVRCPNCEQTFFPELCTESPESRPEAT